MEVRPATPPVAPPAVAPVFCKDCVHFNDKVLKSPPVCMAPRAQTISLVYGPQPNGCADARSDGINSSCGNAGKLFTPASQPDVYANAVAVAREPYAKNPTPIPAPAYSADEISRQAASVLRHAQWGYEDLTELAKAKGRQSEEYKKYCDVTLERIRPRLELILHAAISTLQAHAQSAHHQTSRNATTSPGQHPEPHLHEGLQPKNQD